MGVLTLRLSSLLGIASIAFPPGTRVEDTSLPIRRVVLYKHGVGYFERQGPVSGRAERQERLADIDKNQARIRKNLEALGASAEEKDLRKAYVEQLAADEQAVKALAGEVKELQGQALSRQAELDALLQSFALEYSL